MEEEGRDGRGGEGWKRRGRMDVKGGGGGCGKWGGGWKGRDR